MLSHAIASEDRPALEHCLVAVLEPGIVGLERQPWINHHSEVCVVLEAVEIQGKSESVLSSTLSTVLPRASVNSTNRERRALCCFGARRDFRWAFVLVCFFMAVAFLDIKGFPAPVNVLVTRSLTPCQSECKFSTLLAVTLLYALLGKQVAYYRDKAGLTQEELAEATKYSVDFISLVERGVNAPTVARLKDIADAVGVEVWQLFYPQVGEEVLRKPDQRKSQAKRPPRKRK